MIVGLIGKIDKKETTYLHINVNGLIHEVFVSVNCSSSISGDEIRLYISQIIREDANILYGFIDLNEQLIFNRLIKINGVGPKVAMAICSTYSPSTFSNIVSSSDMSSLKRVPGIGPKSAGRILVELSDFSVNLVKDGETNGTNNNRLDATLALESLGFKKEVILKVLKSITSTNTSSIVKDALKLLQR